MEDLFRDFATDTYLNLDIVILFHLEVNQELIKKTTLGTPDSYFVLPNEKYVFVEYTTQKQNLFKKIKEDLHKCLDIHKTKISHNEIEKIMYFHTSSNIKPH